MAVVILWAVPFSRVGLVLFLAAVVVGGTWAADRVERLLGAKDPGVIVVDEVAGMTLAVVIFPRTLPVLLVAFLLFRVFDIVKPPPAGASQALAGGLGVMVDDLIAGLYTLGLLLLGRLTVGWP